MPGSSQFAIKEKKEAVPSKSEVTKGPAEVPTGIPAENTSKTNVAASSSKEGDNGKDVKVEGSVTQPRKRKLVENPSEKSANAQKQS